MTQTTATATTSLTGKSIIITGAGRGIGRATAIYLASLGAMVAVNDIDEALAREVSSEITANGGQAIALAGSITESHFADQLIKTTLVAFGGLDGLINNAGLHYQQPAWEEDQIRLRQLVEVNLMGTLLCGIAALKHFVDQGSGSIVNVSSGALLGVAGQSAYSATKAAIASLTYGWALDVAPHGVRVNAIAPLAQTRMTESIAKYQGAPDLQPAAAIAPLFAFLLADASRAISGQVLRFDGRRLSHIEPPRISATHETLDNWDIGSFSAFFDHHGQSVLEPVGLGAQNYTGPAPINRNA